MANPTDRSTLPDAELNPLLNPLLARNMGRWAEVYFNAVPEKREEAVQDLVRELEAEEAKREQSIADTNQESFPVPRFNRTPSFVDAASEDSRQSARGPRARACASCGHENPSDQRFCGMCGTNLFADPAAEAQEHETEYTEYDHPPQGTQSGDHNPNYSGPLFGQYGYDDNDRLRSMFQVEPTEPRSYRGIIAVAVAIVAVVLIYVAWHSGQAASALRRVEQGKAAISEQQAPPSNQSAPPNAGDGQQNPNAPAQSGTQNSAGINPSPQEPQPTAQPQRANPPEAVKPAVIAAAGRDKVVSDTADTQEPATALDNGTQELAMAQRYLSGANGQANYAEASQWLWKAVAKRNLQATVDLSDLYLRGEGVAKNCDQGRILLDAAAIRGSKEASVRLQHLQAFGCQ